MTDQNSQFFAILTAVGEAKQANAAALGTSWTFAQMALGDANGTDPIPSRTQTKLINERRRAPLNQVKVDPANPSVIIAEQIIPESVGGWWVRELALYDADGDMVAVANCAPTFKPLLAQGSGRTQVIRINLIVSSTANIELKIDPSVVLATREYVDTVVVEALAKLDFKHSVLVATTANIVLSGIQTVDGVLLPADSRVLVKDQTQAKDNGIYVVPAGGAWIRAQDADASVEVTPGLFVSVEKGTANGDSVWQLVTDAPIVLGTTALTFEVVAGRTGVVAGTYRSLTVDKLGRVIAGTNPTTLAGAGITDAFTKPETASAIQQAISSLVDSSPAALDTLKELAAALGNDANFAATMTNSLAGKMPVAGGNYRPKFLTMGVTDNATGFGAQGGYIGWGNNEQQISGSMHFICNRGLGSGGFIWRSVNSDNTQTGPAMTYSYEGLLTVPSLAVSGVATVATQDGGDNSKRIANTEFVKAWTSQYALRDSITTLGLASGDKNQPYMRKDTTGELVMLQPLKPRDTALLAANGWSKNADTGEIIQWTEVVVGDTPGTTLVPVTWPFQFPNQCLNVKPSLKLAANTQSALGVAASAITTNGCTVRIEEWASVVQTGLVVIVEARGF